METGNMLEKVHMALHEYARANFMWRKEATFIVIGHGAYEELYRDCMKRGTSELDTFDEQNRPRFRGLPIYRTVDINDDQIKIG
jgi:hypothetical protein